MTPAQIQLARRRLALGIANVGFWVLAAAGGLAWLLFRGGGTNGIGLRENALVLAAAVTIQAGFDFLGGCVLMPPPRPTPGRWLRGWLRGALGHTLVLGGVGLLSYASFRAGLGFLPAIVLATVALALGRRFILWAIGGIRTARETDAGEPILVAHGGGGSGSGSDENAPAVARFVPQPGEPALDENAGAAAVAAAAPAPDPAFTGGLVVGVGPGRRALWLLPAAWRRLLPADEIAAERSRRRWGIASGLPGRTLALVLGWNLAGAALGALVLDLSAQPPAGALLLQVCWMTLWTFGSLLLLPSLSRAAVFAADRAALAAGHDPRSWIRRFPSVVGEDGGGGSDLVQTIFYPVPSAARRLERLEKPAGAATGAGAAAATATPAAVGAANAAGAPAAVGAANAAGAAAAGPGFVPGNLARDNLYYSWATCTLLGRAVHCNAGRPALWVFPPSA